MGYLDYVGQQGVSCSRSVEGSGFILIEGTYRSGDYDSGVKVVVINVYAPCTNREKVLLWREIEALLVNVNSPIRCLIGDFNSVRSAAERKGIHSGTVNSCDLARFNDFIEMCALRDIPVVGRKFTWYRPNGTARSRLDRVLVSDKWLLQWQGSKQFVQSRQVSDHCALVVKNSIVDWGPKPFCTFDVWQQSLGFKEVVKKAWDTSAHSGSSMENLREKLKWMKLQIKRWNKEVFVSDKIARQKLIDKISELDQCDDEGTLQDDKRVKRVERC